MSGPDIVMIVFSVLIIGWVYAFGWFALSHVGKDERDIVGFAIFAGAMGAACLFLISLFALMAVGA